MKEQFVYKLEGVNADDGVDIFAIAPVLMQFGELVRNASAVLDLGLDIEVRVKPFREGSWITEFVLNSTIAQDLLAFLRSPEGGDLLLLMALLGINVKEGIAGVAKVVRFTKGMVRKFKQNPDNTITYFNESGQKLTVSLEEHKLVQSPLIQNNYYNCLIAPLDTFPAASAVSISRNNQEEVQKFTSEDKPLFEEYRNAELDEDEVEEEIVSTMHGVYLKPKRGSYSGREKDYSFFMGDNVLYPVTIEDRDFIDRLQAGDVRPFGDDLVKADLEVRQKKGVRNKVTTSYAITKVVDYTKYEKPQQYTIDDLNE